MPPGEKTLSAADCYRFVLSNPNVDLCMIGPRTEKEMTEGAKALSIGPLSKKEMERIKKIGDLLSQIQHYHFGYNHYTEAYLVATK